MCVRDEFILCLMKLKEELNKKHSDSKIYAYVDETLLDLKKKHGVAYTGAVQCFFNEFYQVKISDNFIFTEEENYLVEKLFSMNQLGNNLWGASFRF